MMKKYFTAILAALLLLTSCSGGEATDDTTADTQTVQSEQAEQSVITFASKDSQYAVVRPDEANKSEITAAQSYVTAVAEVLGSRPLFETDYVKLPTIQQLIHRQFKANKPSSL